jgi:hypothetical protein
MRIPIVTALTWLFSAVAAAAAGDPLPGWMAGSWAQIDGDRWTEEYWTPPRAGIMLGAGRNGHGETLAEWESTRIEIGEDGKPVFIASPGGGTAVRFPMASSSPSEIVFTNPAHDYPQRIRYWREGDGLMAEIALIDGNKARQWRYRPIDRPAR